MFFSSSSLLLLSRALFSVNLTHFGLTILHFGILSSKPQRFSPSSKSVISLPIHLRLSPQISVFFPSCFPFFFSACLLKMKPPSWCLLQTPQNSLFREAFGPVFFLSCLTVTKEQVYSKAKCFFPFTVLPLHDHENLSVLWAWNTHIQTEPAVFQQMNYETKANWFTTYELR